MINEFYAGKDQINISEKLYLDFKTLDDNLISLIIDYRAY